MRLHVTGFIAVCIALACGGRSRSPQLPRPQHVETAAAVDVASQNLDPERELDALLQGVHGFGRTVDAVRIAVPPFDTLGLAKEQAWLGEASADVFMTELTHVPGVTVLERGEMARLIEELKRSKDHGAQDIARAGKLLGAQEIIVGSLINDGSGGFLLAIRPVRVETAVSEKGFTIPLSAAHWHDAVAPAVADLAASLGLEVGAHAAPSQPLAPDKLELASRARALQYQGKLVEAQPLYAQALASPSSAWRFEADYLQVMADLGMYDWSAARAKELLLRVPVDATTICDRTRIFMQGNRAKLMNRNVSIGANAIEDTRETVRMAASCGQPELVALALFYYGIAMNRIDHVMAGAANDRALKILGGTNPYTACVLQLQAVDNDIILGGDWHGARDRAYERVGEACSKAGNSRYASVAFGSAASAAWSADRRAVLEKRALDEARAAGGQQLDSTLLAMATELRDSGHPTEADALLLQVIGERLRALDSLYGALPDDVEQLDDEILKRAGYERRHAMPRRLDASTQLLANVHRAALAQALSAWAARTRLTSVRQADAYQRVVDALQPPEPSASGLDAQLALAKLPLPDIDAATAAPLRGSGASLNRAWDALTSAYWEGRTRKPGPELDHEVAAIEKLAGWYGAPAYLRKALIIRAQTMLDAGDFDGALAKARVSLRYAADDPQWQLNVNGFARQVAEKRGNGGEALELARARVEIARKVSPLELVNATYELARAQIREHTAAPDAARQQIVAVAGSLASDQAWESAARALTRAAELWNDSQHVEGSAEAVALYKQRVEWLDHLGDPLRSLQARGDYLMALRDAAAETSRSPRATLASDAEARRVMAEIAGGCAKLVDGGRARDAVRVVVGLPAEAPDSEQLLAQAEQWAQALKDSAEYPVLIGGLHEARALAGGPRDATVAQATLAHDAYAAASPGQALAMFQLIIRNSPTEAATWSSFQRCVAEATAPVARHNCVWGLYYWLVRVQRVTTPDLGAKAQAVASESLPALDRHMPLLDRVTYRGAIAMFATLAHDRATVDKTVADIEQLTAADPTLRASTLVDVAAIASSVDHKLAVDLIQRITASTIDDASRARLYLKLAAAARTAGDTTRERALLADGVAAASRAAPLWVPRYDEYRAEAAIRKSDWRTAETEYAKVLAALTARYPQERRWQQHVGLAIGLSRARRGDLAGARAALAARVEEARRDATSGTAETPCYDVELLETAAAIELAAGRCDAGADLRALATAMRPRCIHQTCRAGEEMACDEPESLTWKATNECRKPLAGTFPVVAD